MDLFQSQEKEMRNQEQKDNGRISTYTEIKHYILAESMGQRRNHKWRGKHTIPKLMRCNESSFNRKI
jgi:hypothetical protein